MGQETIDEKVSKLGRDVHAVKGNQAAQAQTLNEMADTMTAMKAQLEPISKVDFSKLIELVEAVDTMKGGIKVLGWLERPAKWIATISGAAAIIWTAMHWPPGR